MCIRDRVWRSGALWATGVEWGKEGSRGNSERPQVSPTPSLHTHRHRQRSSGARPAPRPRATRSARRSPTAGPRLRRPNHLGYVYVAPQCLCIPLSIGANASTLLHWAPAGGATRMSERLG
eukprot:1385087-Pyramimonas_sp.AAC.1